MDFVEPPFGGESVEVPLLSSTSMSPNDSEWLELRRRNSFVDATGKLDTTRPQSEIAGFVQSWLYFGLLAVLCDKTIDGHGFSTLGKRWPRIVKSELVKSALTDMKLSALHLPYAKCMDALERHQKLLVKADEAVRWVEGHFTGRLSKLVDLILLSVKVLIGTIAQSYDCAGDNMFGKLCGASLQWYRVAQRRGDHPKASDRALEARMIENGWCVHQIRKILSTFSYQTAYYFARLPRPRSGRLGHETCSEVSCRGWDSKPGATYARHATVGCTCSSISVSSQEVAEIIRGNKIPLVSIEEDVHGSMSLKLHKRKRTSKYVAISHVWADGLGNAFEDGLPTCQLRMLQTYFSQISKDQSSWFPFTKYTASPLFWMDTLCIPVQVAPPGIPFSSEDLADIKGRAIDKMNIVYSCSSHTLVLDDEMRTIPASADDPTKLAYSQCCGWTTRSWTLQEGCLPPLTVFALADDIYSYESRRFGRQFTFRLHFVVLVIAALFWKMLNVPGLAIVSRGLTVDTVAKNFNFPVHREIWASFSKRSFSIWGASVYNAVSSGKAFATRNKYAEIWNELLDRASSQPADIPAIFANLVGVSAYEVLKGDTEQKRVALIIRQQKVLPIEMLYNTGPRLHERLYTQRPLVPQIQDQFVAPEDAEEAIGLLDMSEPQSQPFRNGWVPAMIRGDRMSQPLKGELYLQVFEHYLQIHEKDKEQYPYMYTTTTLEIPTSTFMLSPNCQDEGSGCADYVNIAVTRVVDSVHSTREEDEAVIGHCFLYDAGSMMAMSKGLISHAQGVHLIILARSDGRITTRYSDPIRLNRVGTGPGSEMLPQVNCGCSLHGQKEFVDILYDAEDLGPLLSSLPKSPGQMFLDHWFNPIAIFMAHWFFSRALRPYIGTARPVAVTVAWFVIPVVVYLYQNVVLKAAAKRLFLEPLNDRGRLHTQATSWTKDLQRRMDTTIVAPWSVVLFGPVLDGMFWLALKGSEGTQSSIESKQRLLISTIFVSYWYLYIGANDRKIVTWYYLISFSIVIADSLYKLVTVGLTVYGMIPYCVLLINIWIFKTTVDAMWRSRR